MVTHPFVVGWQQLGEFGLLGGTTLIYGIRFVNFCNIYILFNLACVSDLEVVAFVVS